MPEITTTLRRLRRSIRRRGAVATLRELGARALGRDHNEEELLEFVRAQDGSFDTDYNVDTGGFMKINDMAVKSDNWEDAGDYQATSIELFHEMLAQIDIGHGKYTFIDVGAGKGRALLLALAYPFHRVIGVEFVPQLCEIAERNFETYTGPVVCRDTEVVCADIDNYELPAGPLVVFLYNPFAGGLMRRFAQKLALRPDGAPTYVLYCNAEQAQAFQSQAYTELSATSSYRIYRVEASAAVTA